MRAMTEVERRGRAVKEGPVWIWAFTAAVLLAAVLTVVGILWANQDQRITTGGHVPAAATGTR